MYQLPYTRTEIQVRFSDLDFLKHVSNSVYAQYFDLARVHFFREIGKHVEAPRHVVASVKIDMLREIHFDQTVVVDTWCSKVGNKSLNIEHRIFANDVCVTTSQCVLVGFDLEKRCSSPFPQDWQPTDLSLVPGLSEA
jgi:acyl-CoA thioester hydrolase